MSPTSDSFDLHPHRPERVAVEVPDTALDPELRARLHGCTVAIIGCGGLGSNVAEMLVRSGVGRLTLVDFDTVDEGNLNRQFFFRDQIGMPKVIALAENLQRIRSDVRLDLVQDRVTPENLVGLVRGACAIVEAVDEAGVKAMIVNTCLAELPDIPLVTASGLAGYGSTNAIVTERMADGLYVVGDLTSDVRDGHPLFASRVMAAAAAQAHAVVRVLLGYREP
ncbi:sulfur carrier protein ThiS adenylyltransferase ThiF [Anaerosoma tenue]|uniref:sulfur carrier protein ThiS adenylyltransferase ThiF n=1 Tax=Anaerosoma tenue TaxID=2933588 RepID=UPI002260CAC4|nr:sulfur carrier protein ThiS adenylyltransferase ThiF [Anaerosoma tenue]MCK8115793.1 sulfur carrier protein ThiS adenylyltransferase ThiF [Anaerosoma tenue]